MRKAFLSLIIFGIVSNILIIYKFYGFIIDKPVFKIETTEHRPISDVIVYRSGSYNENIANIYQRQEEIVVVIVSCGERIQETNNNLKSAIVFANSPLRLILFTEELNVNRFVHFLENLRQAMNDLFTYEVHLISYPNVVNWTEWKKLSGACSSQRLFLPILLKNLDAAIYVDADVLFMRPLEEMWDLFKVMNSTQEVAMATECDLPHGGYYEVMAKHPYVKPGGLNAGVMMMNLTRMRGHQWESHIVKYYEEYKPLLHSGDQDLVNIYLSLNPGRGMVLNDRYNFRPHKTYCDDSLGVVSAAEIGAAIVHGTAGQFFGESAPVFVLLFNLWRKYEVGSDPYLNLYIPLVHMLKGIDEISCARYTKTFTQGMRDQFKTPWE